MSQRVKSQCRRHQRDSWSADSGPPNSAASVGAGGSADHDCDLNLACKRPLLQMLGKRGPDWANGWRNPGPIGVAGFIGVGPVGREVAGVLATRRSAQATVGPPAPGCAPPTKRRIKGTVVVGPQLGGEIGRCHCNSGWVCGSQLSGLAGRPRFGFARPPFQRHGRIDRAFAGIRRSYD